METVKRCFKTAVSLLLAVLMLVSMAGCSGCSKKRKNPEEVKNPVIEDPFTDIDLVQDGKASYKIVIPANASPTLTFAASELQLFFKEATGITLDVKPDTNLVFDDGACYFSIGNTTLFQGSGVVADFATLNTDGLRLVTRGSTVIMAGGGDNGAMYAMYEFLERTFHFENYASDEYYIDRNVTDLKLKDFDVTEIPVFNRRSVGLHSYSNDSVFRNRMRQQLYNDGWIYWSHSHFRILPKEKYESAHPDWYSPDGTQLCLTNDEMREEFTRVIIDLVKANPDCGYIQLGQEDVNTFCTCPRCKAQTAIYKNSGVMMHFVNKVADDVQAYIDENEPGRVFYLSTFGYHQTQNAPINDNYEPIDDSVRPHKNVMILVAPIFACNAHSYNERCNSDLEPVLRGWRAVAEGHLFFWIYNKIFNNYFIPFNNFGSTVDDYNILADLGAQFVYHQGNKETEAGGMEELKCYVQAKLMWDTAQGYDALADDFITHYYKEAAPYYRQYYDLVRMHYTRWVEDGLHCYNNGTSSSAVFDTKYWTQDLLDQFESLFAAMLEAIKPHEQSNPTFYETMRMRVEKEHLTVRYLYLELYFDKLSYDTAKEWINSFEQICGKCGISVWKEMYLSTNTDALLSTLVTKWRTKLNQK